MQCTQYGIWEPLNKAILGLCYFDNCRGEFNHLCPGERCIGYTKGRHELGDSGSSEHFIFE